MYTSTTLKSFVAPQVTLESLKDHEALDYDLWCLQLYLTSNLNSKISWRKIKSHATEKQIDEQGKIPTQLNEKMDEWANLGRSIAYVPPTQFIPAAKVMAIINGDYIHGAIRPHLHFQGSSPAMREYLMLKNSWTRDIFNTIDWEPTRHTLSSLPKHQHHTLIKYLHDWLQDGKQIDKFSVPTAPL